MDKRKKLYKIISDYRRSPLFRQSSVEKPRKKKIKKEAQKLLDNYGKKLSPAAWIALGKKTGFELRRSMTELEKLIFFVGERPLIEEKDVEEVVGKTKEDSIFDLTTALK